VIVYFGQYFENYRSSPDLGLLFPWQKLCIHCYKNGLGYVLGDFSQTHPVALLDSPSGTRCRNFSVELNFPEKSSVPSGQSARA
jgi:hypothetical protein